MANWLANKVFGNDDTDQKSGSDDPTFKKINFDSTKHARCFLAPVGKKKKELTLCPVGCDNLSRYFSNMVSLIGLAGNGKSTLGSTLYNLMRSNKIDYFAMSDAMESYTQGVWCLNECMPSKDEIGVFDLQGLENENIVHYMVIISVALSKALVLCSSIHNPRFDFSMLKTLATAFDLLDKFNIKLPKPVIFIQAPYQQYSTNTFKLKDLIVDTDGLIEYCKSDICPKLKEFDIRIFGLPKFDKEGRFDSEYIKQVRSLLNQLSQIGEGPRMKERIKYAKVVTKALNSDSPQMVTQLNLFNFKTETQLIINKLISKHTKLMQDKYSTIVLTKKDSMEDFIAMADLARECEFYLTQIINEMKSVPYYDEDSKECENMIKSIMNDSRNGKLFANPNDYVKPYYDSAINDLKLKNIAKGNAIKETQTQAMEAFVKLEISQAISKIEFYGSTYMPSDFDYKVKDKRSKYIAELMAATDNDAQIDKDYLNVDIESKWESAVCTLKSGWEEQKTIAKQKRCEVRTKNDNGDKCPSCGSEHGPFVVHKKCGNDARWLWCNPPTKHAICDTCTTVDTITTVCCWNCDTVINITIIDPPSHL